MTVFDELKSQYDEIDQYYAIKEFQAAARGWTRKEANYKRRREINDQAYFLFMFTRLEDRIRQQSSMLIQRKKDSISSWKTRAPWDLLPNQPDADMSFKKRLALLCETGGSNYNKIVAYYKERNSIAHGGSFVDPISVPTVVNEMRQLYRILKA